MRAVSTGEVVFVLRAWNSEDNQILNHQHPCVRVFHQLGHFYMVGERLGHSMQTAACDQLYLNPVDIQQVSGIHRTICVVYGLPLALACPSRLSRFAISASGKPCASSRTLSTSAAGYRTRSAMLSGSCTVRSVEAPPCQRM